MTSRGVRNTHGVTRTRIRTASARREEQATLRLLAALALVERLQTPPTLAVRERLELALGPSFARELDRRLGRDGHAANGPRRLGVAA